MVKGKGSMVLMAKMAEKRMASSRHQRRVEQAERRKAEKKGQHK